MGGFSNVLEARQPLRMPTIKTQMRKDACLNFPYAKRYAWASVRERTLKMKRVCFSLTPLVSHASARHFVDAAHSSCSSSCSFT